MAAGVSRGTPGYFFGAKAELYRAVLERCLEQVRVAVRSGRERAIASRESPEVVLAGAVGEYFDFITARPNFVRLMEWEALSGGQQLRDVPPHLAAAREAVAAIGRRSWASTRPDPAPMKPPSSCSASSASAGSRWCIPAPCSAPSASIRRPPSSGKRASAT